MEHRNLQARTPHHLQVWSKATHERCRPLVYGASGCHPYYAGEWDGFKQRLMLDSFRSHPRLVAAGEMDFDFSRGNHVRGDVQRRVFQRQLLIAVEEELQLILYLREAEKDGFEMVERFVPQSRPIHWHCVTGQWPVVRKFRDMFQNSFFGFTPLISNPRACNARMVAQELSLDRVAVESDAPYFQPQEYRDQTKWSRPSMAFNVIQTLATMHGASEDSVIHETNQNVKKLYGIA